MNNYHEVIHFCRHFVESHQSNSNSLLVLSALASAAAAIFTWIVASKQKDIAQNAYTNFLHDKYFHMTAATKGGKMTTKEKQMFSNFFEYICWNLEKGRIGPQDLDLFLTDMKDKEIVGYARRRSKENPDYCEYYLRWVKLNK